MPYTYILECADGTYYTGSTWSLALRLSEHERGEGAAYTLHRRPVKLAWSQYYERIDKAFEREKAIQRWSHAKKRALAEGKYEEIRRLAKKTFPKAGKANRPGQDGSIASR